MKPTIRPIAFTMVLALAFTPGGCGKKKIKKPANATVSKISKNKWSVRVERKHKGHSASGQVVVKVPSGKTSLPHVKVAGARAWLALAESRLAAKDINGAIASADAGIKELGDDYDDGL